MPFETKPFLNLVLSLDQNLSLSAPILHNLAALAVKADSPDVSGDFLSEGILHRRLSRHYLRLCRVTDELGQLDFKKAAPGNHKDFSFKNFSLEDFVFSRINFSRYREIDEKDFVLFLPEALTDFSEGFYQKNFGLCRGEVQSVIEGSYRKKEGQVKKADNSKIAGPYEMTKGNPLILSVMRTLETSLENLPLFTSEEIRKEAEKLPELSGKRIGIPDMNVLYRLLVLSLNNVSVTHGDGMVTKLFVSREGELTGTFRPGNKPWTRVLIPGTW